MSKGTQYDTFDWITGNICTIKIRGDSEKKVDKNYLLDWS